MSSPVNESLQHEAMSPIQSKVTAGRNDPCPCGSEKKFKKCCIDDPAYQALPDLPIVSSTEMMQKLAGTPPAPRNERNSASNSSLAHRKPTTHLRRV